MEAVLVFLLMIFVAYVLVDGWGAALRPAGTVWRRQEVLPVAAGGAVYFCGAAALLLARSSSHVRFDCFVGITALPVLIMHGALRVAMAASSGPQRRARRLASGMYWLVCAALLVSGIAGFAAQPLLGSSFMQASWIWVLPLVATAGLFGLRLCVSSRLDAGAFLCSSVFIAGLLCTAVATFYLGLLPVSRAL
jgi:cytochrome bd-type quinol oxidase subunit 2